MLPALAALAAFLPQSPGTSTAPVVINEFSFDDAGGDDKEFVELFNRTLAPVDISGWTLQGEEGSAGGTPNGAFSFPAGTVLGPGQYLVVGMANVPNVTFFTTSAAPPEWLGENVAGAASLPDGLTLRDAAGNVVDAVAWNYAVWTAPVPAWLEGSGLYGAMQLVDGVGQAMQGMLTAQRRTNGHDDDDNGRDFVQMIWTPGSANAQFNTVVPAVVETCDGALGSTLNATFAFGFVPAVLFDPAAVLVATGTTKVFPPSPQGGNVARIQDPTGGGNMVTSQCVLLGDYNFELYVYVVPGNPALLPGEGESWAIGVCGTTDTFAHPHDVSGGYYAQTSLCGTSRSPGGTGVAWIAYVGPSSTELYVADLGNGGPGAVSLAGPIVCTPGVNDGWQRLRLRVSGTSLVANFGGTFGVDDGQRFTGVVSPGVGSVYLQYRECIVANANMTGLLVDRVELFNALDAGVAFSGVPSPTSVGLPNIGTAGGPPQVGNGAFQITATGLVPNGLSIVALDLGVLLPGVPVPGAPPGLLLYALPTATPTVFNSAAGVGVLPLPLPASNVLSGVVLAAQYFDLDFSLGVPLPFGSSRGAQIQIGNG